MQSNMYVVRFTVACGHWPGLIFPLKPLPDWLVAACCYEA